MPITTICCIVAMGLHLNSVHIQPEQNFNNVNTGIYAKLDNNIIVGTYYNSIRRQSSYVVKEYKYSNKLSIEYGIITGYNKSVVPVVLPTYNITKKLQDFLSS